jgi:hypothetical protein
MPSSGIPVNDNLLKLKATLSLNGDLYNYNTNGAHKNAKNIEMMDITVQ